MKHTPRPHDAQEALDQLSSLLRPLDPNLPRHAQPELTPEAEQEAQQEALKLIAHLWRNDPQLLQEMLHLHYTSPENGSVMSALSEVAIIEAYGDYGLQHPERVPEMAIKALMSCVESPFPEVWHVTGGVFARWEKIRRHHPNAARLQREAAFVLAANLHPENIGTSVAPEAVNAFYQGAAEHGYRPESTVLPQQQFLQSKGRERKRLAQRHYPLILAVAPLQSEQVQREIVRLTEQHFDLAPSATKDTLNSLLEQPHTHQMRSALSSAFKKMSDGGHQANVARMLHDLNLIDPPAWLPKTDEQKEEQRRVHHLHHLQQAVKAGLQAKATHQASAPTPTPEATCPTHPPKPIS